MSARRVVMISSTARDLPEHRAEIRLGCERAGFEPRVMEHLPALDADAVKASLGMVEEADVYVGIFGFRYGYVPEGHDISITEMENDRAAELKKPRLIFFMDEDHPVTKKDVETGPGERKLQALKDKLGKQRVVTFFRSPKDLRAHVNGCQNPRKDGAAKKGRARLARIGTKYGDGCRLGEDWRSRWILFR